MSGFLSVFSYIQVKMTYMGLCDPEHKHSSFPNKSHRVCYLWYDYTYAHAHAYPATHTYTCMLLLVETLRHQTFRGSSMTPKRRRDTFISLEIHPSITPLLSFSEQSNYSLLLLVHLLSITLLSITLLSITLLSITLQTTTYNCSQIHAYFI